MLHDQDARSALGKTLRQRYDSRIKYKEDYWLWKLWPTKGSLVWDDVIWLSNRETSFATLAHESGHVQDQEKMGLFNFALRYFQPQWLAIIPLVFMIAGIGFSLTWAWIAGLVATIAMVMPWPSKQRVALELNAELLNMAVCYWEHKKIPEDYKQKIVDSLCGWAYYKMIWWGRRDLEYQIDDIAYRIINEHDQLMENQAYSDAYKAFYGTT